MGIAANDEAHGTSDALTAADRTRPGEGSAHEPCAGPGAGLAAVMASRNRGFGDPLIRNGYSLVVNVAISSGLGLVYWIVAARLFSPEQMGINAALISTMVSLNALAELNLASVLTRFLPTARDPRSWILGAYGIGAAGSILCCLAFLFGVDLWLPKLDVLTDEPLLALWFTGATMTWTIFALQDGALTGLRRAIWIPVENTVFALAKIALLVVFAAAGFHAFGVFASWTVPLLALVIPINVLVFRRILPGVQRPTGRGSPPRLRSIARFAGGDFLGTLFFSAAYGGAPLLVLEMLGTAENATYYLAWTIAYSLYLVGESLSASLTAEGSAHRERLEELAARAMGHTLLLLSLGIAVIVLAAPIVLGLFGAAYVDEGVLLLRILALSALPFGIICVHLGVARVEGRIAAVAGLQAAMMILVLGCGAAFLQRFGLVGIAIAWLLAQSLIALIVIASRPDILKSAALALGVHRGVERPR